MRSFPRGEYAVKTEQQKAAERYIDAYRRAVYGPDAWEIAGSIIGHLLKWVMIGALLYGGYRFGVWVIGPSPQPLESKVGVEK